MSTVAALKKRMASTARWMMVLEDGLNGRPHSLGDGEGMAFKKRMKELGVSLYSETRAKKEGLTLRRGAKPVVRCYYGAPIQAHVWLYVREQLNPAEIAAQDTESAEWDVVMDSDWPVVVVTERSKEIIRISPSEIMDSLGQQFVSAYLAEHMTPNAGIERLQSSPLE